MQFPIYTLRAYGTLKDGPNAGLVLDGDALPDPEFENRKKLEARAQSTLVYLDGYITLSLRDGATDGPPGDVVVGTFGPAPRGLIGNLALTGLDPSTKDQRYVIRFGTGVYLGASRPVSTRQAALRFVTHRQAEERIQNLRRTQGFLSLTLLATARILLVNK